MSQDKHDAPKRPGPRFRSFLDRLQQNVGASLTITAQVTLADPDGPVPGLIPEQADGKTVTGKIALADVKRLVDHPNVIGFRPGAKVALPEAAPSFNLNLHQILANAATVVGRMNRPHVDARLQRHIQHPHRRAQIAQDPQPTGTTEASATPRLSAHEAAPAEDAPVALSAVTDTTAPDVAPQDLVLVDVMARLSDPTVQVPGLRISRQLGHLVTGHVAAGDFDGVSQHPNILSLRSSRPIYHDLERSVREIRADPNALRLALPARADGLDGSGVIIGIIDTDADFVHANFRREDGSTRILALWDQRGGETPLSPADYNYGREYRSDDINAALKDGSPYIRLGYTPSRWNPQRSSGSHGTFVMDIAAGNGAATGLPGVAPGADIIFVHAETDGVVAGTSEFGTSKNIAEAALYIFEIAEALGRSAVVNISMSAYGGPHDGSTLVDRWFEQLLDVPGRAIVIAAGNSWTDRIHTCGTIAPGESRTLEIEIPLKTSDAIQTSDSEIEVWYPGAHTLEITMFNAADVAYGPVPPGEVLRSQIGTLTAVEIFHTLHDADNHDNHVDVLLNELMEGSWRLQLTNTGERPVPFHAWIERERSYTGQARFSIADECRTHTLGSLSCGIRTIVVGSYKVNADSRAISPFSSEGPTRDGRQKPEISAPGQSSDPFLEMGITCAQAHLPLPVRQSGTSIAAPHVTGAIALMMQSSDKPLSIEEIRSALRLSARHLRGESSEWDARLGAGRLNVAGAIRALRGDDAKDLAIDVTEDIPGLQTLISALTRIARESNSRIRINIEIEPTE
ncbi:MAG: S8 family serine peptidase [Myxococcota bacterium]